MVYLCLHPNTGGGGRLPALWTLPLEPRGSHDGLHLKTQADGCWENETEIMKPLPSDFLRWNIHNTEH